VSQPVQLPQQIYNHFILLAEIVKKNKGRHAKAAGTANTFLYGNRALIRIPGMR
jgi:hypothetical protein